MKNYFLALMLMTVFVPLSGMKEEPKKVMEKSSFDHRPMFNFLKQFDTHILEPILDQIFVESCSGSYIIPRRHLVDGIWQVPEPSIFHDICSAPHMLPVEKEDAESGDEERASRRKFTKYENGVLQRGTMSYVLMEGPGVSPNKRKYIKGNMVEQGITQEEIEEKRWVVPHLAYKDKEITTESPIDSIQWHNYLFDCGRSRGKSFYMIDQSEVGVRWQQLSPGRLFDVWPITELDSRRKLEVHGSQWKIGALQALLIASNGDWFFGMTRDRVHILRERKILGLSFLGLVPSITIPKVEQAGFFGERSKGKCSYQFLIMKNVTYRNPFLKNISTKIERTELQYVAWPLLVMQERLSRIQKIFILTALAGIKHGKKWHIPWPKPWKSEFTDEQRKQIRDIPRLCLDYLKVVGAIE